jgi:hypothetical protein
MKNLKKVIYGIFEKKIEKFGNGQFLTFFEISDKKSFWLTFFVVSERACQN